VLVVYCSDASGGDGEGKGYERVEMTVRSEIIRAAELPPEFISGRLIMIFLS